MALAIRLLHNWAVTTKAGCYDPVLSQIIIVLVGSATPRTFGIRNIGQLVEPNPKTLQGWFGKVVYSLSAFARDLDNSLVARQAMLSPLIKVWKTA